MAAIELDQVVLDHPTRLVVHGDAHVRVVVDVAVTDSVEVTVHFDAVVARSQHLEAVHHDPIAAVIVRDGMVFGADDDGLPLLLRLQRRGPVPRALEPARHVDRSAVDTGAEDQRGAAARFRQRHRRRGERLLPRAVPIRRAVGGDIVDVGCR